MNVLVILIFCFFMTLCSTVRTVFFDTLSVLFGSLLEVLVVQYTLFNYNKIPRPGKRIELSFLPGHQAGTGLNSIGGRDIVSGSTSCPFGLLMGREHVGVGHLHP